MFYIFHYFISVYNAIELDIYELYCNTSVFCILNFFFRTLILFYHYGFEKKEDTPEDCERENIYEPKKSESLNIPASDSQNLKTDASDRDTVSVIDQQSSNSADTLLDVVSICSSFNVSRRTSNDGVVNLNILPDMKNLKDKIADISMTAEIDNHSLSAEGEHQLKDELHNNKCLKCGVMPTQLPKLAPAGAGETSSQRKLYKIQRVPGNKLEDPKRSFDSGLYVYVDFHGHASKKGI